ncbi:MAG: hypothetical protein M3143_13660 [Actinomycetota bacterium]|nr:hypothetical protein [Actinomycetota bacterium]
MTIEDRMGVTRVDGGAPASAGHRSGLRRRRQHHRGQHRQSDPWETLWLKLPASPPGHRHQRGTGAEHGAAAAGWTALGLGLAVVATALGGMAGSKIRPGRKAIDARTAR